MRLYELFDITYINKIHLFFISLSKTWSSYDIDDFLKSLSKSVLISIKHAEKPWFVRIQNKQIDFRDFEKGYLWKILTNMNVKWSVTTWNILVWESLKSWK